MTGPEMSNHPLTLDFQRELLQGLLQAVADRVQAEEQLSSQQTGRIGSEDEAYRAACEALDEQRLQKRTTVLRQYEVVREELTSRYGAEISATKIEYADRLHVVETTSDDDREAAEKDYAEAQWMVSAEFDDGANDSPKHQFETYKSR